MNVRKFLLQSGIKIDKFLASTKLFRSSGGKSDTVFFPGCSLSGYNPDYVFKVRDYLKCGILTSCCAKPLKLMGETKTFQSRIEGIKSELDKINAETVITRIFFFIGPAAVILRITHNLYQNAFLLVIKTDKILEKECATP